MINRLGGWFAKIVKILIWFCFDQDGAQHII